MEQRKIMGQVRAIPDNVDETRTITFTASDESIDRHKTVIPAKNWRIDSFNANPIIGWQHNVYGDAFLKDPDPDQIIGRGYAYMEEGKMLTDVTFEKAENNPLAEKIFNKIKDGILNAVSVGFIESTEGRMGQKDLGENPNVYYFGEVELIELSVVSIPSNKNALKKDMEEYVEMRKAQLTPKEEKPENKKEVKYIVNVKKVSNDLM